MASSPTVTIAREYRLNMPHMAMGGLSETWLFKEMGDAHWALITKGLQTRSSGLTDANGSRLYATFTRIQFRSSVPLVRFDEDDDVALSGTIERFGASYFFSDLVFAAGDKRIEARLMSTFAKRQNEGSNLGLLKGQPVIPPDCGIRSLDEQPAFAGEFRAHRDASENPHLFRTEYDLQPIHDVNGVNLLYFAAYPAISSLCEGRFHERPMDWALGESTIARDVFYSANCELDDRIVYKLHAEGDGISRSTLARASDGKMMGYIVTQRA